MAQDAQPVSLTVQSPPPQPIRLTPQNEDSTRQDNVNQAVYVDIPPDVPPPPYESFVNSERFQGMQL